MATRALLSRPVSPAVPSLASSLLPGNSQVAARRTASLAPESVKSSRRSVRRFAAAVLDNQFSKAEDGKSDERVFGVENDQLTSYYHASLQLDQEPEEKLSEEASVIISKQWPETFFERNVDDLVMHYRQSQPDCKESQEVDNLYPSGEWPENLFSVSLEDIKSHYIPLERKVNIHQRLAEIMETDVKCICPGSLVRNAKKLFLDVSGLPVVIDHNICVGILTRDDMPNMVYAVGTKVGEVMSSPPIVLKSDDTVRDAAVLMLKHKIHHIPIVNDDQKLVGLVTRTHVFTALES